MIKANPASWTSYPSIFNLGHGAIKDLLNGPVIVEEKIDGSQFSMCLDDTGELLLRSKGAIIYNDALERMFIKAVKSAQLLKLHPDWTYRCEYLAKPKHNTLAYDRIPNQNLILFDVSVGHEKYLSYDQKVIEGARIGLEVVPCLYKGIIDKVELLCSILNETISVLGGQKIEGVVIKPVDYDIFGVDKKVLLGKFVSEAFKEIHHKTWQDDNNSTKDIIQKLKEEYATPARWNKAISYLKDMGRLEDSPRDIGSLIKEVQQDVLKECEEEIKNKVFKWAWSQLGRKLTAGLPEWYKQELLKKQFEKEVS